MKMFFVLNARLPNKKAYGIHAAKTCEAFLESGVDVTLVIPRTRASREDIKEFYHLRVDVPTVVLPGVDWYGYGRIPFAISSLTFMLVSFFYLAWKRLRGKLDIVYSVDMDTFSFALLPLVGAPCFVEIHATKKDTAVCGFFFRRVTGVLTLNSAIRDELAERFHISRAKFLVEPCGVEESWFASRVGREEARAKLGIAPSIHMAAYIGRFYDWKGLDIIPRAFAKIPDVHCYLVGGTKEQFEKATGIGQIPDNVHIAGECASYEVPVWHAASDVLLVPWTLRQGAYHQNVSPMKIYEYMAAKRIMVGGDHPAVTSIVSDDEAILYEPDNADDLARAVSEALSGGSRIPGMVERAYTAACLHTLPARAQRTLEFIRARI